MTVFDLVFPMVVGIEGGLSMDPKDPGNYTPAGVLKGTKYGVSARSFPDVDIPNLTPDKAKVLFKPRFWDTIRGDEIHAWVACIMFDSSVNEGPAVAIKHLQIALGIAVTGVFDGPTLLAMEMRIARSNLQWLLAEYTAQRNLSYTRDSKFQTYSHSWFARTALILVLATTLHS